jgi:hypothetical protein
MKIPANVVHGTDSYWSGLNDYLQAQDIINEDERLIKATVSIDANGETKLNEYTTMPLTR